MLFADGMSINLCKFKISSKAMEGTCSVVECFKVLTHKPVVPRLIPLLAIQVSRKIFVAGFPGVRYTIPCTAAHTRIVNIQEYPPRQTFLPVGFLTPVVSHVKHGTIKPLTRIIRKICLSPCPSCEPTP